MSRLVEKAIVFATRKHEGQTYGGGFPFIVHPQQTADIISRVTGDQKLIAAAWLHDTLEDTDTTYDELVGEFGQEVADLVLEVTHEGERDHIGFYFPNLKTQRGIMLKFADRLCNISHMEGWPARKKQHYLGKSKFWSSGTP